MAGKNLDNLKNLNISHKHQNILTFKTLGQMAQDRHTISSECPQVCAQEQHLKGHEVTWPLRPELSLLMSGGCVAVTSSDRTSPSAQENSHRFQMKLLSVVNRGKILPHERKWPLNAHCVHKRGRALLSSICMRQAERSPSTVTWKQKIPKTFHKSGIKAVTQTQLPFYPLSHFMNQHWVQIRKTQTMLHRMQTCQTRALTSGFWFHGVSLVFTSWCVTLCHHSFISSSNITFSSLFVMFWSRDDRL